MSSMRSLFSSKRVIGVVYHWYPDPLNAQQKRFWDGTRWTDQVGPLP